MGRFFVRRTWGSILRSAKSFMTHPAERMTNTPATNTSTTTGSGSPAPAIHNAHSVGHSSSREPIGWCMRASSAYWMMRSLYLTIVRSRSDPAADDGRNPGLVSGEELGGGSLDVGNQG